MSEDLRAIPDASTEYAQGRPRAIEFCRPCLTYYRPWLSPHDHGTEGATDAG